MVNECGCNPGVIARQLSHIEGKRVGAAYHRSFHLKDHLKLVRWWADYLDGRETADVVKMPKCKAQLLEFGRSPLWMEDGHHALLL